MRPAQGKKEENDPQEKVRIEQIQYQYALLRSQFDEKSAALETARKELFQVENRLLTLQKVQDEKNFEIAEENLLLAKDLRILEEECINLETQISSLQDLIAVLITPKKRSSRPRKSSEKMEDQNVLPLLLQEKIDHSSSIHSI